MYNIGTATITDSTLSGNTSTGAGVGGGGILNGGAGAVLTLNGSTLADNTAVVGGGIFNSGTATVQKSTLHVNDAAGGGGIFAQGSESFTSVTTLSQSTLSSNVATDDGGGIHNNEYAVMMVQNSTLSGNSAERNGGGIFNIANESTTTLSVINGTLFLNSADNSGGNLFIDSGSATIRNSIFASNGGGGDCVGFTVGSIVSSVMQDGSCGVIHGVNGNIVANPLLDFLADNGGATQTNALLPGSPAIGSADQMVCDAAPISSVDQRGYLRDNDCDMGAYEVNAVPTAVTMQRSATTTPAAWLLYVAILLMLLSLGNLLRAAKRNDC